MSVRRLMICSAVTSLVIGTVACDGVFKFSDTGLFGFDDSADPFDGVGDGSTSGDADGVNGTITGLVKVQPYEINSDGDVEYVDWETMSDGEFPYGNIFVSAYTTDEVSGEREYHAQQSILAPATEGDTYELTVDVDDASAVTLYAALDFHGDGVIGMTEPIGVYPNPIAVEDGDVISDVDITILAEAQYVSSGGGSGGSGGGGDDSANCVTLSGMVDINVGYAGGEVGVMLQDPSTGDGPMDYSVGWAVPQGDSEGAEGEYSFEVCGISGEANLIGGWDKNYNRLLDPSDRWGAFVSSEDVDGNPVTLELGTNLEDHTVQIPLGDSAAFDVVPMIHLIGEVSMNDGSSFDSLPTHTNVYVGALKYRPEGDVSVSNIPDGYDYAAFDWSQLSGQTSVEFDLVVPSNTTLYLWAYADTDGDGVLNEAGEPLAASTGSDNGRISVQSVDLIGYELMFQVPEKTE